MVSSFNYSNFGTQFMFPGQFGNFGSMDFLDYTDGLDSDFYKMSIFNNNRSNYFNTGGVTGYSAQGGTGMFDFLYNTTPAVQSTTSQCTTPSGAVSHTETRAERRERRRTERQERHQQRHQEQTFNTNANNLRIDTPFNGSADDLNKSLKGKLAGKGNVFLEAQRQYGINAGFLASVCMLESGNGSSNLANTKNNVGGVRIPGKTEFKTYASVDECIMHIARFLRNGYANKGLTTITQVGAKYCPVNDPTDYKGTNNRWASSVSRIYDNNFLA